MTSLGLFRGDDQWRIPCSGMCEASRNFDTDRVSDPRKKIAAVVFLIVERAYTRRATIGSKIRPPSAGHFVKAVVNSNYQGIALCDGRNSRENDAELHRKS
ncbi:hypothetical protein P5673_005050 [Acropora cervicornis]|uniref:Uncharacterized protein n=1 Tax=Acropora cervicornis TaxID=6130 RepID=A0AAD9QZM0_ACRCE|nr:hypothetical protein P5673_005050 [Acropora cervicornis]